jgi:putative addiction module component (TIGR02574 family)
MSLANIQQLYEQAHILPALDKLNLIERLLVDLDQPNNEIAHIWSKEAAKRWQAYQSGHLQTVSYDEVMKELSL